MEPCQQRYNKGQQNLVVRSCGHNAGSSSACSAAAGRAGESRMGTNGAGDCRLSANRRVSSHQNSTTHRKTKRVFRVKFQHSDVAWVNAVGGLHVVQMKFSEEKISYYRRAVGIESIVISVVRSQVSARYDLNLLPSPEQRGEYGRPRPKNENAKAQYTVVKTF